MSNDDNNYDDNITLPRTFTWRRSRCHFHFYSESQDYFFYKSNNANSLINSRENKCAMRVTKHEWQHCCKQLKIKHIHYHIKNSNLCKIYSWPNLSLHFSCLLLSFFTLFSQNFGLFEWLKMADWILNKKYILCNSRKISEKLKFPLYPTKKKLNEAAAN